MAVHTIGDNIILGVTLCTKNFCDLVREHRRRYPKTADVEALGYELREEGFPKELISAFVRNVCNWGGYAGIGGRVLNNNSVEAIRNTLKEADELLSAPSPDFEGALRRLNCLHSLGSPSFASKHLRFLRPDICPVFDSILRDALPYSYDLEGYGDFARDCRDIGRVLESACVDNPVSRADALWFTADVESALFVHFSGWV